MAKIYAHKTKSDPTFDLVYFMEVSKENRVEQELIDLFQTKWDEWKKHVNVYCLNNSPNDPKADGWLLVYLDKEVEVDVEREWQNRPVDGMKIHNLAITLAMSAAHALIPELTEGFCAPLPTPSKDIRKQFKRLGLTWNDEGSVNRNYAVFTPIPYRGGCELCHTKLTCPNSVAVDRRNV